MPNNAQPQPGLVSSRPNLPTVHRRLQALHQLATAKGYLTIQQAHEYQQLSSAWEFYRDGQPMRYRGVVDALVEMVGQFAVQGGN